MGTPDFAVPSLKILLETGYEIVGVITSTDKMGGRGKKQLIQSAVKKYALERGLNILQPQNLKHPDFVKELRALKADLQVVVAFRMLPEVVWNMPPLGTVNLHGSLLPKYRGAAPINWAIINGEKETGVTTFLLKHEIDTGDILLCEPLPIGENETAGEIHDKMMEMGAELVLKTVRALESGDYQPVPQDRSEVTKAPKIFHETCEINFHQDTEEVHNFIRGLSPYPTAWTILDDKKLKIFKTEKEIRDHDFAPGEFIANNRKELKVSTLDGFVHLLEVQLAGKKRMKIDNFLKGFKGKLSGRKCQIGRRLSTGN